MKALFQHELYVVLDTYADEVELERLDCDVRRRVSLAAPTLVIDPTDGDIDEADALLNYRGHCCDCPHEHYTTVSIELSRHLCHGCGDTFTDTQRTKRYFGNKA